MINQLTKFIFSVLIMLPTTLCASEKMTIIYSEQSPYIMHGSWGPYGLIGDVARNISIKASLEFIWEKRSVLRQKHTLEQNPANTCLLGVSKKKSWEDLGVYTLPIYQEKNYYLFARKDDAFFTSELTLRDILSNQQRKLIKVKRYPYQDSLLRIITDFNPPFITIRAQAEFALIALEEGRGDYVFLSESEGAYLAHLAKRSMEQFKKLKPTDLPPGQKHYFLCSKATGKPLINTLNNAIKEITHGGKMH